MTINNNLKMKSRINKIVMCIVMVLVCAGAVNAQKVRLPKRHFQQKSKYVTTVAQNGLLEKMTQVICDAKKVMPDFCWDYTEWRTILTIDYNSVKGQPTTEDLIHLFKGEPVSRDILICITMSAQPLGDYIVKYKNYNYVFGNLIEGDISKLFKFVKKRLKYKVPSSIIWLDKPYMFILYKASGQMEVPPFKIEDCGLY